MCEDRGEVLDEWLVLAWRTGDRKAPALLARRWQPRFVAYARRLLGQPDASMDAVQETWLAITRQLNQLKEPARFRAWAYGILTNKCRDEIRRQQRNRKLETAMVHEQSDPSVPNAELDPRLVQTLAALTRLAPEQRGLLSLYYVDGLSVAELAQVFKINTGTVKSRLFYARRALKKEVNYSAPPGGELSSEELEAQGDSES